MLRNYFRIARRNLLRSKIYSAINIAGLSMGLACVMLIILFVKDEMSYDHFHKDINRIYVIGRKMNRSNGDISFSGSTGYFQGPRFKNAIPEIQDFVRFQRGYLDIKTGADIQSQEVFYADTDFFSVFSFPLLTGNPRTALVEPYSVVISEEMAEKKFGTTAVTGKILLLKKNDQFVPYTISAVARKCPQNSSLKFQVLLPLITSEKDELRNENWFNSFLTTFVVVSPNADPKVVEAKMKKVFEADATEAIKMIREKYGIRDIGIAHILESFGGLHLNTRLQTEGGISDLSKPVYSYILSGIAVFILLIACINFVNLTVARSVKRGREIGIRKVVGGVRKQLILQFLGESFVVCFLGFLLSIIMVQAVLPFFNRISGKSLSFSYLLDLKLIAGYGLLFIITGFLAGCYPALVLSKLNPVQTLYNRFQSSGNFFLQKSLVIFQFTLASFLIIATLTISLQFNFLTNEKTGYDDTNLVTVPINHWGTKPADVQLIKDQLLKDGNFGQVAAKNGGLWNTTAKVNDQTQVTFAYETIDESYLPLMKVPVLQGRNFSSAFPSDSMQSILVNETFVKQAGWKNPLGQQVSFFDGKEKYTVIGVTKDYHFEPLTEKIRPQLFTMNPENGYGMFLIKIKPASEAASLGHIEKIFKSLFPQDPFTFSFRDLDNKKSYEAEARWKQVILAAAFITIFISCIGLFGLSVLAAEKRTKEIGIRKTLGASVSSVVTMLSMDFLKLVAIALLIAVPVGWLAAGQWLQHYPYRMELQGWMFIVAAALVIFVALATISFQAIKAGLSSPVKSLRTE